MRIRSTDVLFGLPALELRRLLQRLGRWQEFEMESVRDVLPMSRRAAQRLIVELATNGYIEPGEKHRSAPQGWKLTIRGRAFSIASAARPIRRATAERLLAAFLDRIDAVNADTGLQYRVAEAVVFGSYLGDEPTLGDVDVGVRLASRLPPGADVRAHRQKRVALAKLNGRTFYGWSDEFLWPYREVMLKLKSRSRGLSLHDMEDDALFERDSLTMRVIYADGRRVESPQRDGQGAGGGRQRAAP